MLRLFISLTLSLEVDNVQQLMVWLYFRSQNYSVLMFASSKVVKRKLLSKKGVTKLSYMLTIKKLSYMLHNIKKDMKSLLCLPLFPTLLSS